MASRLFADIQLAAALERVDLDAAPAVILGSLSTERSTRSLVASAHIVPLDPHSGPILWSESPDKEEDGGEIGAGILLPPNFAPRLVAPTPHGTMVAAEPWLPLPAWLVDAPLYSRLDYWGVSIVNREEGGLRLIPDIDLRP
jgi:hypothetical protein